MICISVATLSAPPRSYFLAVTAADYLAAMARSPTETIRFLTVEEVVRLFAIARASPRDRALFLIVYRHGLRASEFGLLRDDGIYLVGHTLKRTAAIRVGNPSPISFDAVPCSHLDERGTDADVPVQHSAASVEGERLDSRLCQLCLLCIPRNAASVSSGSGRRV